MSQRNDRFLDNKIGSSQIARALQELVGDRGVTVLPTQQNMFLEHFSAVGIRPENHRAIVATRQLSGYPVVIPIGMEEY